MSAVVDGLKPTQPMRPWTLMDVRRLQAKGIEVSRCWDSMLAEGVFWCTACNRLHLSLPVRRLISLLGLKNYCTPDISKEQMDVLIRKLGAHWPLPDQPSEAGGSGEGQNTDSDSGGETAGGSQPGTGSQGGSAPARSSAASTAAGYTASMSGTGGRSAESGSGSGSGAPTSSVSAVTRGNTGVASGGGKTFQSPSSFLTKDEKDNGGVEGVAAPLRDLVKMAARPDDPNNQGVGERIGEGTYSGLSSWDPTNLPDDPYATGRDVAKALRSWGGRYTSGWDRHYVSPTEAKRANKALDILFRLLDPGETGQVTVPRVHGQKLVRELVNSRMNLARALRTATRGHLVVLVDVSGSCGHAAAALYAASRKIADANPRVVVITHSNGYPDAAYGKLTQQLGECPDSSIGTEKLVPWWLTTLRARLAPVSGVLALGDWDAAWAYRPIVENGLPFAWLDPSTRGSKEAALVPEHLRPHWAKQPAIHYVNVLNIASLLRAVESGIRMAK